MQSTPYVRTLSHQILYANRKCPVFSKKNKALSLWLYVIYIFCFFFVFLFNITKLQIFFMVAKFICTFREKSFTLRLLKILRRYGAVRSHKKIKVNSGGNFAGKQHPLSIRDKRWLWYDLPLLWFRVGHRAICQHAYLHKKAVAELDFSAVLQKCRTR